jgi:hypothetical protein
MTEHEEKVEKLHKAVGQVHGLVKSMADHHAKLHKVHTEKAEHHEKLSKAHAEHAAFISGKADGLEDEHADKAYFGKAAEIHKLKASHHEALSKLHKEAAEDHAGHGAALEKAHGEMGSCLGGAAKTAAAGAPANAGNGSISKSAEGAGIDEMIQKTTDNLVNKALEQLNSDPKVTERIQEIVLNRVNSALGDKIVPDHVRGVMPPNVRLVTRDGGPTKVQVETADESPLVAQIFND